MKQRALLTAFIVVGAHGFAPTALDKQHSSISLEMGLFDKVRVDHY
jgi:hypothetical protein